MSDLPGKIGNAVVLTGLALLILLAIAVGNMAIQSMRFYQACDVAASDSWVRNVGRLADRCVDGADKRLFDGPKPWTIIWTK